MYSTTCYPPVKFNEHPQGPAPGTTRKYVKYVPVGYVESHSMAVGYVLWLIGFTGAHRFYYGKPLTGILWFFTFGLLGIGWLVDAFLIPSMNQEANIRFTPGVIDFNLTWVLFAFFGIFGVHRIYQRKFFTGVLYFLTGGLFLVGLIYDAVTLNDQISAVNSRSHMAW